MRDAMRGASRVPGAGEAGPLGGSGLRRHPGAGGGVEVLSDTQGVDFRAWLERWHHETENTWDPLIPDEVNPPINKQGIVVISFKVLPNGRLMEGSLRLEGRSGDSALDRAAWGALTGSNYPPLPRDFHGPYHRTARQFLVQRDAAELRTEFECPRAFSSGGLGRKFPLRRCVVDGECRDGQGHPARREGPSVRFREADGCRPGPAALHRPAPAAKTAPARKQSCLRS